MTSLLPDRPRVLVIGDSLINGLGCTATPFGRLAAEQLGAADVLDLSAVSRMCRDVLEDEVTRTRIREFRADLAVLCVGGTESLMRPNDTLQRLVERFAPAAWHGVAGLEPRARYSRSRLRRWRQQLESRLKVALKTLLFRVFGGGTPRVPFAELDVHLEQLITVVSTASAHTVVVGLPDVDPRLFPGTVAAFARTNDRLAQLSAHADATTFLDLHNVLARWGDYLADHLHYAASGHRRVAERVVATLPARSR